MIPEPAQDSGERTEWRVVGDSAGFFGVSTVAQTAADEHCRRYEHQPAIFGDHPVLLGMVARCAACGRSIAMVTADA